MGGKLTMSGKNHGGFRRVKITGQSDGVDVLPSERQLSLRRRVIGCIGQDVGRAQTPILPISSRRTGRQHSRIIRERHVALTKSDSVLALAHTVKHLEVLLRDTPLGEVHFDGLDADIGGTGRNVELGRDVGGHGGWRGVRTEKSQKGLVVVETSVGIAEYMMIERYQ